jgi:large subunit ribosomal protein L21
MSFAVIQTGGKQYKVSTNEILKIERLNDQEGKVIEFKNVLFLNDDKTIEIGNPNIQGAKVEAKILKNKKNKTILVFKKRRRKNSRKKYGHRQPISLVKITKIFSKNGKLIAQSEPKKEKISIKSEKIESTKSIKAGDISLRVSKAEETRKLQEEEVKELNEIEKKRLEEAQKRIKLQTKKSDLIKKKTATKKKPLTTTKK